MLHLVEVVGVLDEQGRIEIPPSVLGQTGISAGEYVKLFYMAQVETMENEMREFLLFGGGLGTERQQGEETVLKIPQELLASAEIPADADLDIMCGDRRIVILPTEDAEELFVPAELSALCREIGLTEDRVRITLASPEEE